VLNTIKSKFGIQGNNLYTDDGYLHNGLRIPYLNGIDTWDNIDESTIIGPEEHIVEHKGVSFVQNKYKAYQNTVNYRGIDIIAKCMQYS
jgi:hypothetical protein